jgi:hypothetical protein
MMVCLKFCVEYHYLDIKILLFIYIDIISNFIKFNIHPSWELMKSVGIHGSLSLPFMMKMMVWHFVNVVHNVMTAIILSVLVLVCWN